MNTPAFEPNSTTSTAVQVLPTVDDVMTDARKACALTVTIAGCGGTGINLARPFLNKDDADVIFLDTSMTNSRHGERVIMLTSGDGSGSHRAENAREIESKLPQLGDKLLDNDVAIVVFSLAGGSGSVAGPLLIRHYASKGKRVIAVAIADTSSAVGAKNTLNTLKTLTAITRNNDIYLPMIILSNDLSESRGAVDQSAVVYMHNLLTLLTSTVYEVDRNDRLNWINPMKVINSTPGIKLVQFFEEDSKANASLIMGTDSTEMVDSLLVLQASPDEVGTTALPRARLKKMGFYADPNNVGQRRTRLAGRVSSDILSVENIISQVEETQNLEKSQRHVGTLDKLQTTGDSDMIL